MTPNEYSLDPWDEFMEPIIPGEEVPEAAPSEAAAPGHEVNGTGNYGGDNLNLLDDNIARFGQPLSSVQSNGLNVIQNDMNLQNFDLQNSNLEGIWGEDFAAQGISDFSGNFNTNVGIDHANGNSLFTQGAYNDNLGHQNPSSAANAYNMGVQNSFAANSSHLGYQQPFGSDGSGMGLQNSFAANGSHLGYQQPFGSDGSGMGLQNSFAANDSNMGYQQPFEKNGFGMGPQQPFGINGYGRNHADQSAHHGDYTTYQFAGNGTNGSYMGHNQPPSNGSSHQPLQLVQGSSASIQGHQQGVANYPTGNGIIGESQPPPQHGNRDPISTDLHTLYHAYVAGYTDEYATMASHLERANGFIYTLLQRVYPAHDSFSVEPAALDVMAKYGWTIDTLREPMNHGATSEMVRYYTIPKENLSCFVVKKNFDVVDQDGTTHRRSVPHTYVTIMVDNLRTFHRWHRESHQANSRGDIVKLLIDKAQIRRGYSIVIIGTRIEFYRYDLDSNLGAYEVLCLDVSNRLKSIQPLEETKNGYQRLVKNCSFDMKELGLDAIIRTLKNVTGISPTYKDGVIPDEDED